MVRYAGILLLIGAALLVPRHLSGQGDLQSLLGTPILEAGQTLKDLQQFIETRLPPLPKAVSAQAWEEEVARLRAEMFDKVVFRGAAAAWREAQCKVEWLDTLSGGDGYRLKQVRFEAVPGLWIPALLYEPLDLKGKVPATLNVMGHDRGGKDVAYQQIRCINLARRGMLALNVEWYFFGQLSAPQYNHGSMNQLDLCGTSGLAPFYLALKRGLDLLLSHPHADPKRVAVSGLSGGGWQTIYISSLDTRVTLTNPVAGYSSFRTRIRHHKDLGDSEQTPCDMATVADYDHLTAMMAPRATLLTYNAKDNCCFEAGYALPPLIEGAVPFFKLFDRARALRGHINHDPGTHNYEKDNREAFYKMIGDFFFPEDKAFRAAEISCDKEIKNKQELLVPLPQGNASINSLALELSKDLPRQAGPPENPAALAAWTKDYRAKLSKIVHYKKYGVKAELVRKDAFDGVEAHSWRLRLDSDWTIPVVDLNPGGKKPVVIRLHDKGRAALATEKNGGALPGKRVVAIDPLLLGETKVGTRDYLWALTVGTVGERPLGIQAGQVAAVARWLKERGLGPIGVRGDGPRSSVIALVAAALEPDAIASAELHGSMNSLKEIIQQNRIVADMPELFCFGLLESFDLNHIADLTATGSVRFEGPAAK